MEAYEIEGEAEAIRERAELNDSPIPGELFASRLPWVLGVLGIWAPVYPRAWRAANDDGFDTIFVHTQVRERARNWIVAGEGVEGYFVRREPKLIEPAVKPLVWAVTAATLLPRYPLRKKLSEWGLDVPRLAEHFGVTQVVLARRLAEVRGTPYAVMTPTKTLRNGLGLTSAQLARIVFTRDRRFQVIELTDARAWVVWPKDW